MLPTRQVAGGWGSSGRRPCKVHDKPCFDGECRRMKRQLRQSMMSDVETGRVLARRYITVLRRKCRQHRHKQTPARLSQFCGNDVAFWRRFNKKPGGLPTPLASHQPLQQHHTKLCAPTGTRISPRAQPPGAPPVIRVSQQPQSGFRSPVSSP